MEQNFKNRRGKGSLERFKAKCKSKKEEEIFK